MPKHAKLDCGLLCRGRARLRWGSCNESRLVAFSCKGRGFCPSCLGRRMCATAANLIEHVLPEVALRQWVLTFPFPWRRRLAHDGALLSALTRIFVESVHAFYVECAAAGGMPRRRPEPRSTTRTVLVWLQVDTASNGASARVEERL